MTNKQKLMYQIFAVFMIASMTLSGLAYFIGYGLTSSNNNNINENNGNSGNSQQSQLQNPAAAIRFDDVGGKLINAKFNSISDALNITPQGVVAAQFTNVERSIGTPLQNYVAQSMQQQNELYNENVGNSYGAMLDGGKKILQYNILPSKSLKFGYIINPEPYNGFNILRREGGLQNVIGTPVMLTNSDTISNAALDIISGAGNNESAYSNFASVLNYSSNADIIAYVDTNISLASIFYSGFRMGAESPAAAGQGTRTLIYQDISTNASSKIDTLANNETDAIDVTVKTYNDENITVVKLVSDLNSLFMANI